jgi:hypothetical protein
MKPVPFEVIPSSAKNTQRIEATNAEHPIVGEGRIVPRRETRVHPAANRNQIAEAVFGPRWERPSKRCVKCHDWMSSDGHCACKGYRQLMDTTEIIANAPRSAENETEANPERASVRKHLEEWMALPLLPENTTETWHLATKVGCLLVNVDAAEATGLYSRELHDVEDLALGDVTIEVDGEWRRYRVPPELGWWASDQVQAAFEGRNRFPAFLSLRRGDTGFDVRIRPLRV